MTNRRAVALGLLAGSVAAVALVAAVVAFGPEVAVVPSPPPSQGAASPSTSAVEASSAQPSSPLPAGLTTAPSSVTSPAASPRSSSSAGAPSPAPSAATNPAGSPAPGGTSPASSTGAGARFHVGQHAPALVVPQIGGGQIDLAALQGHPVWIEFMATWCPSCRDEFPLMNGFAARYARDGLVVLAIDVKEDEAGVAAFAESLSTAFPVGVDGNGTAARAWGVAALPVHFFVDATGIVRDGAIGGIGPDLMAAALRKIMPGVTVTP